MSSDRNERLKVYCAGSEKGPTFDDDLRSRKEKKGQEVGVITNYFYISASSLKRY